TVMSNMGLSFALRNRGVSLFTTAVGDRSVMEGMKAHGAVLGGEDSGHIIFMHHHTTGDGILSALQILLAQRRSGKALSELAAVMTIFPQSLINVPVKRKPDLAAVPEIEAAIRRAEASLGDRGRVLIRYSGTEPVCRVMVEGEEKTDVENHAREIADVIQESLGT
ncbi:MAG: phosphoglucosamine mutase, partial [Deltaproteobacteria bacterium]